MPLLILTIYTFNYRLSDKDVNIKFLKSTNDLEIINIKETSGIINFMKSCLFRHGRSNGDQRTLIRKRTTALLFYKSFTFNFTRKIRLEFSLFGASALTLGIARLKSLGNSVPASIVKKTILLFLQSESALYSLLSARPCRSFGNFLSISRAFSP